MALTGRGLFGLLQGVIGIIFSIEGFYGAEKFDRQTLRRVWHRNLHITRAITITITFSITIVSMFITITITISIPIVLFFTATAPEMFQFIVFLCVSSMLRYEDSAFDVLSSLPNDLYGAFEMGIPTL